MSKYEEALERARKHYKETPNNVYKAMLEQIFPDIEESEDKKIKEEIVNYFQCQSRDEPCRKHIHDKWIAWLEKQANHANFCNKIQIGDKVTRNEDGVLVNLSQLNRVAKKDEKQNEQKPACSDDKKLTDVNHEYFSELLENNDSEDINDYAHQVAYCMSHDWIEETATWDDVQKACKLGAQWNKITNGELTVLEQSIEEDKIVDSLVLKRLLNKLKNICNNN